MIITALFFPVAHAVGRDRNCRVKLIGKDDINGLIVHPGAASGSDTRRQRCFLGVKTKVLSSVRKHTVIVAHLAFIRQSNRLLADLHDGKLIPAFC